MRPAPSLALLGALVLHGLLLFGPWLGPERLEPSTPAVRVNARFTKPSAPPSEIPPSPAPVPESPRAELVPLSPVSDAVPSAETGAPSSAPPDTPETVPDAAPSMDPELYRSLVREAVAGQKKYPYAARVRGQQGTAVVRFALDAAGALQSPPLIARSSGVPRLDEAARAAVAAAVYLPPPPGFDATFDLPVEFVLNSSP